MLLTAVQSSWPLLDVDVTVTSLRSFRLENTNKSCPQFHCLCQTPQVSTVKKIFRKHQQAVSIVSLLVPYTSGQYSQILCYKHQQAMSIVSLLVPYTSGQYSEILFYKQQQAMSIYSFIACAIHLRSVQWNNTLSTPTSRVHSFIACAIYLRSNLLWCSFIHIKPFMQCINSNTQLWVKKGNFTHKVPEIKQLNNRWSLFNRAQFRALCTGLGQTTPTHVDICTCFHT